MFSYGLPLLALLAAGILWVARSRGRSRRAGRGGRPRARVRCRRILVVAGLPGAHDPVPVRRRGRPSIRLLGVGGLGRPGDQRRPGLVGASIAAAAVHLRRPGQLAGSRAIAVLAVTAGIAVWLLADLSGMSKAEVERIWLPFVPLAATRHRVPARALAASRAGRLSSRSRWRASTCSTPAGSKPSIRRSCRLTYFSVPALPTRVLMVVTRAAI